MAVHEVLERLLSIVDELSCKEMAVLRAIKLYEEQYYENGQFAEEHRPHEGKLQAIVEERLGLQPGQLPDNELLGIVIRLNCTGLLLNDGLAARASN